MVSPIDREPELIVLPSGEPLPRRARPVVDADRARPSEVIAPTEVMASSDATATRTTSAAAATVTSREVNVADLSDLARPVGRADTPAVVSGAHGEMTPRPRAEPTPTTRSEGPARRAEGASPSRPVRPGEVSRLKPSVSSGVTAAPTGARSPGREPLSPFVAWSAEAQAPLSLEAPSDDGEGRGMLVEIITAPERFALRVVEGRSMEATIAGLLGVAVLGSAAFALVVRLDLGLLVAVGAGLRLALSVVLAVAAAIGPIHAAGVLVAARVPLPRLVAVMLASTAVGAAALAPLGPVVRFLHGYDAEWWGPLSLVGAFVVAAAVASVTLRRLLLALAEEASAASGRGALSEGDLFRVGIVARMALVFLGYTSVLALWGVGAFS
jgi:hypothetical protein